MANIYSDSIVELVLRQLNEEVDIPQIEEYKGHVLAAVNEALAEIYRHKLTMICTDTVALSANGANLNYLTKPCLSVISVQKNGEDVDFSIAGVFLKTESMPCNVTVTYKSYPRINSANEQLPVRENLSYMLADYAVYKILSAGSLERQARGQVYYQSYLKAYSLLNSEDNSKIKNKY